MRRAGSVLAHDIPALATTVNALGSKTTMTQHDDSTILEVEYRIVPGFPGYRVGNDGSVWTRNRPRCDWFNEKWKRMSPGVGKWGHHQVRFCVKGRQFRFGLHRLVLELFVGPCPEGHEGCHNDGNPRNNHVGNLRWDTVVGNKADMNLHGTHNKGERNSHAKLTEADVIALRSMGSIPDSEIAELSRIRSVTVNSIRSAISGATWKHIAQPARADSDRPSE